MFDFEPIASDKLPYWVNPKSSPIVNEFGDLLGEKLPTRPEIGDDSTQVASHPLICLSDCKDAVSFAAQMALVDNQPSTPTCEGRLDTFDACDKLQNALSNL